MSTESLPNVIEPLLPFIHFNGKLTNPSDLLFAVGAFLSDAIETIGQFSLSMYRFELKDGVKIVELNYTLSSSASSKLKKQTKTAEKKLAANKVWQSQNYFFQCKANLLFIFEMKAHFIHLNWSLHLSFLILLDFLYEIKNVKITQSSERRENLNHFQKVKCTISA